MITKENLANYEQAIQLFIKIKGSTTEGYIFTLKALISNQINYEVTLKPTDSFYHLTEFLRRIAITNAKSSPTLYSTLPPKTLVKLPQALESLLPLEKN